MEKAILAYSLEHPGHGCLSVAQNLALQGVQVSSGGVRGVWARHRLLTKHERLLRLERRVSKNKIKWSGEQVRMLERFSPEFRERHKEIWQGDRFYEVVDAKYRNYWEADPSTGRAKRKVDSGDLYQLFFYQQRMKQTHGLPALPMAFIACPLPGSRPEGPRHGKVQPIKQAKDLPLIPERLRKISWLAGGETAGELNLIFLFITDILEAWEDFLPFEKIPMIRDQMSLKTLVEGPCRPKDSGPLGVSKIA